MSRCMCAVNMSRMGDETLLENGPGHCTRWWSQHGKVNTCNTFTSIASASAETCIESNLFSGGHSFCYACMHMHASALDASSAFPDLMHISNEAGKNSRKAPFY